MTEIPASVRTADRAVGWLTCAATVAALGLSYRNQLDFATQRGGYPVWAAVVFPLIMDIPFIVGELRLFSATARDEGWRIKLWGWALVIGGLSASVAAGIAHVGLSAPGGMKLAAAAPPLVAAASLVTGLGIVKLSTRRKQAERREDGHAPRRPAVRAASRPRARSSSPALVPAQVASWIAEDTAAGLPMGRVTFLARHKDEGLTEHGAKVALRASRNGHGG